MKIKFRAGRSENRYVLVSAGLRIYEIGIRTYIKNEMITYLRLPFNHDISACNFTKKMSALDVEGT